MSIKKVFYYRRIRNWIMKKANKSSSNITQSKRRHYKRRNDTLVSTAMLKYATQAILRRKKLDRSYDIPYLAGYSRDARTIYIDRHLPKFFNTRGRRVGIDRFLILHEAVEKSLFDEIGLQLSTCTSDCPSCRRGCGQSGRYIVAWIRPIHATLH